MFNIYSAVDFCCFYESLCSKPLNAEFTWIQCWNLAYNIDREATELRKRNECIRYSVCLLWRQKFILYGNQNLINK